MKIKLLFEQTGTGHFALNNNEDLAFEFKFSFVLNDQVSGEMYALYHMGYGWEVTNLNGSNNAYQLSCEIEDVFKEQFDNNVDVEKIFLEVDHCFEEFCNDVMMFSVSVLDGKNNWNEFFSKYFEFETDSL